jgi:hypothetical protein
MKLSIFVELLGGSPKLVTSYSYAKVVQPENVLSCCQGSVSAWGNE